MTGVSLRVSDQKTRTKFQVASSLLYAETDAEDSREAMARPSLRSAAQTLLVCVYANDGRRQTVEILLEAELPMLRRYTAPCDP